MTNEQIKNLPYKIVGLESTINGFTLTNNLYHNLTPLTVDTCKVGVNVLTKAGSHFKVEIINKHRSRKGDLTIEVGNGKHGNMYGSYNGVFPSLKIQVK